MLFIPLVIIAGASVAFPQAVEKTVSCGQMQSVMLGFVCMWLVAVRSVAFAKPAVEEKSCEAKDDCTASLPSREAAAAK